MSDERPSWNFPFSGTGAMLAVTLRTWVYDGQAVPGRAVLVRLPDAGQPVMLASPSFPEMLADFVAERCHAEELARHIAADHLDALER